MNSRGLAARVLEQVIRHRKTIKAAFAQFESVRLEPRDRAFAQELVYGVCRWYFDLAFELSKRLHKPLRAKDCDVQCLLMVGLYQLLHLQTPPHAIVKETVAATKDINKPWSRGLVNACLRGAIRAYETESWDAITAQERSQPTWLLEQLKSDWPQHARQLLAAYTQRPPFSVRVNLSRTSRGDYLQLLSAADIEAKILPHTQGGVHITHPVAMTSLPGFANGLVSAQDQAAQIAAELLAPAPHERILDACAAPGGKACHCLESTGGKSQLLALDNDSSRLELVAQNLERLGFQAQLVCADASTPDAWWDGHAFDKILVDAPCSASGVMRRHPDIKLHRQASDLAALATLQHKILRALWPTLKPGGSLLYVTCSIFKCENDDVINRFIQQSKDCEVLSIDAEWGRATSFGRQILPGDDDMDGFFYAHLYKRLPPECN